MLYCASRTDIDLDNPQHEVYVTNLVASLIQELENRVNIMGGAEEMFLLRRKLLHALENFNVSDSHLTSFQLKQLVQC
jgi:hypothetical protein